jgi:hypothetical protein
MIFLQQLTAVQLLKKLLGFTGTCHWHIHIFTYCFSEIHYPPFTHLIPSGSFLEVQKLTPNKWKQWWQSNYTVMFTSAQICLLHPITHAD